MSQGQVNSLFTQSSDSAMQTFFSCLREERIIYNSVLHKTLQTKVVANIKIYEFKNSCGYLGISHNEKSAQQQ
jgi:hypothetical protein